MPSLSVFQCLPLHIAKKIATYYACAVMGNDYSLTERLNPCVWTTLYNVSYSWRELALQYFFDEAVLDIPIEDPSGQLKYPNLPKDIDLDPQRLNYARSLAVSHSDDVTPSEDGNLIERLTAAWPVNIVFPYARTLAIDLCKFIPRGDNQTRPINNKQLQLLYQQIQSTMPKLQDLTLGECMSNFIGGMENSDWRQTLTSVLSSIHNNARLFYIDRNDIQLANNFLFPSAETSLTQIDCALSNRSRSFSSIIKMSAPTLESFTDKGVRSLSLRSFLVDDDNNPIVYPRLQKLYVGNGHNSDPIEKIKIDKSIVPFPVLRQLTWQSNYIFESDELFRGNSNTLEYVDICVDVRLAGLLEKHKVFSNGSYPKLQYASFRKIPVNEGRVFPDQSFEIFVVNSVGPKTGYLQHSIRKLSYINSIMHKAPFMKNIQVLMMPEFRGKVVELLDVIRLLPNLIKLQCPSGKFDHLSNTVQFKEFINDYRKMHYPLSLRFRRWDGNVHGKDEGSIARTGLAFAMLCPNFALISTIPCYEEGYKNDIKEVLECGIFSEYTESIKPLLQHNQGVVTAFKEYVV